MREPKYKLRKEDEARWRMLVLKDCAQIITPEEAVELKRLDREYHRRIWSHPRFQAIKKRNARQSRQAQRLMAKLKALLPKS